MDKRITQSDIKKEVEKNKKAIDKAVNMAIDRAFSKQKIFKKANDKQ